MQPECLILDDSRMVRAIARNLLESFGFLVSEADSGREALLQCQNKMPDMMLVDWNMPDMSGIEFIETIKASNDKPIPKLLLCSTETRLKVIREAMKKGADSYLMKPFDRVALGHRLRRFGFNAS